MPKADTIADYARYWKKLGLNPLDFEIAIHVMGWKPKSAPAAYGGMSPGWTYWTGQGIPESYGPYYEQWKPSTDLNLCALAEARVIEMGLADAYDDALSIAMDEANESIWHPVLLKMAGAELRCRAMLKALEAQS